MVVATAHTTLISATMDQTTSSPSPVPGATATQSLPPESFNEVYLKELGELRPDAFRDRAAAAKLISTTLPQAAVEENERARAKDLADLFGEVHTRLNQRDPETGNTPLAALCVSGGGIRSATFNLGLIQGLARIGLLRRFDYISSVSGGGYIAGWLNAWMYRDGTEEVVRELALTADRQPVSGNGKADAKTLGDSATRRSPLAPEPRALDQLREYSNYLTPKVGLFSPDTWTAVALVIRNLILNWLVFIPLLAAAIAVPQAAVLAVQTRPSQIWQRLVVSLALAVALFASVLVHWLRRPKWDGTRRGQRIIVLGVVMPVYLAAALLSLGGAWVPWAWWSARTLMPWLSLGPKIARLLELTAFIGIWTLVIPVAGWSLTELAQGIIGPKWARGRSRWWELFALVVSGVLAGAILVWIAYSTICGGVCGQTAYFLDRPILFVILALPTLLGDYLIARTLFVAIASLGEEKVAGTAASDGYLASVLDDFDREWWGRLSGWVIAMALGWLAFSGLSLLGGYLLQMSLVRFAPEIVAGMGGTAGIITAILAKSSDTSSGRGTTTGSTSRLKNILLKTAAPVFIIVLAAFLALGTAALGRNVTGVKDLLRYPHDSAITTSATDSAARADSATQSRPAAKRRPTPILDALKVKEIEPVTGQTFWTFVFMGVVLAGVSLAFARVVDVNRYSMHGLYRNRLVRAYLGASNLKRAPDPFTGFATTDNVSLSALWPRRTSIASEASAIRLIPVVNTTLNLVTGSKRLAWQMRKAESFSMTPFYCGNFHEGYRPTAQYGGRGGMSLGTAMTISGAAANPNMGYNSSPTLTFLMSLLNARLGAWLGNTNAHGSDVFGLTGPKYAIKPLIAELLGQTSSDHEYINLSDGGHFDNLGIYEMVLRRCRYILVGDAGRDPSAGFEDLGNAIRKIRIDFGIPIEFRKRIRIFPAEERTASLFCATAEIRYSEIDGPNAPVGQLVYLKPAVFGQGEPIPYDVLAYSKTSQDFPHESTTDQWFDEAQFESYRALGLHAITQVSRAAGSTTSFPAFLAAVEQYINAAVKNQ